MGFCPTADQALPIHFLLEPSYLTKPTEIHILSDKEIINLNYSPAFFPPTYHKSMQPFVAKQENPTSREDQTKEKLCCCIAKVKEGTRMQHHPGTDRTPPLY